MNGLGRTLTDKERETFCALVKYPTKNDREIAEITGINLSTVTAIRRRLLAAGCFTKVRIPMVHYLGAELLTIAYGPISTSVDRKKRDKLCQEFSKRHSSIFLHMTTDDFCVLMLISRNYTEVKRDIDGLQHFLGGNKLEGARPWQYVMFPFEVSSLINFFDYSYAMNHLVCNVPYKVPEIDLRYKRYKKRSLTAKEKAAIMGLVAHPTLPDNAIAKKVGVSRQTLSSMRQRFLDDGLLLELNIPDLDILDGILVFSHMLFNPNCMLEDRKEGVKLVLEDSPAIFIVSGSFESVLMHLVPDFERFNQYKNRLISYYTTKDFLRGEGSINLMPVTSLRMHKFFDFRGILENLLAHENE